MPFVAEGLFNSQSVILAFGRQLANGAPNITSLWKTLFTNLQIGLSSDMVDLGYEGGAGISVQFGELKDLFQGSLNVTWHLRTNTSIKQALKMANYNWLETGIATATPFSGTTSILAAKDTNSVTMSAAPTGVADGDLLQLGTVSSPVASSDTCFIMKVLGAPVGNVITFSTKIPNQLASGATVVRVDANKNFHQEAVHIEPGDVAHGGGDKFTAYVRWASSSGVTQEVLMIDGKLDALQIQLGMGNVATCTAKINFLNAVIDTSIISTAYSALQNDPAPYVMQNTRGSFNIFGDTINSPRQITLNLATGLYKDARLFQYLPQTNDPLGHAVNITTNGLHYNQLWKLINFGATSQAVNDAILTDVFQFKGQSPILIGTSSTPFGFGFRANTVQGANYNPTAANNAPLVADLQLCRVIPDPLTNAKNWSFILDTNLYSNVVAGG